MGTLPIYTRRILVQIDHRGAASWSILPRDIVRPISVEVKLNEWWSSGPVVKRPKDRQLPACAYAALLVA